MWVDGELIAGAAVACAGIIPALDPTTTPTTNKTKTTNRRMNESIGDHHRFDLCRQGEPTSNMPCEGEITFAVLFDHQRVLSVLLLGPITATLMYSFM